MKDIWTDMGLSYFNNFVINFVFSFTLDLNVNYKYSSE